MRNTGGFGNFYGHYNRIARVDGDAGTDAGAGGGLGKAAWTPEALGSFFAGLGTFFSGTLDGAAKVVDSTASNAKAMPVNGVQNLNLPTSGNNRALLWMIGGGVLLVMLLLVLVLRRK